MRYSCDMDTATAPSRRERARAATMAEIKQTALELMREQGHTDVRFSDIARAMGLTPPALYRYYGDRDELLTELITDAYRDLAAALVAPVHPQEPVDARESLDPQAHLLLVASAYRAWALSEPHKFALIFGPPVPGYAAPEEGPTVEAAQGAMANLAAVVHRAAAQGALGDPIVADVDPDTRTSLTSEEKSGSVGGDLPVATHQAMLHAWAALHGFVCLEAYGHFDWFPVEARDGLFRTQVRLAGLAIGFRDA
jgi:AcrR family transcriptional regulator